MTNASTSRRIPNKVSLTIMPKPIVLAFLLLPAAAWSQTKHTVATHDCLWSLAQTYYHDPFKWKALEAANAGLIKNPDRIYPGQVLVIPDIAALPNVEPPADSAVDAAAPVDQAPSSASPAPETAETAAAPAPPQPSPAKAKAAGPGGLEDQPADLSAQMPPAMTGFGPSMRRMRLLAGWTSDGTVSGGIDGHETASAEGDVVVGRLAKADVGDSFDVFRPAARLQADPPGASYLQFVGTVQVQRFAGKSNYELVILKSNDTVQEGDLLKRRGS